MSILKPSLFGLKYSNRDFTQENTWGKNQFNSSFPTALSSYLEYRGFENVYLCLNDKLEVIHKSIATSQVYGLESLSNDLFFSFESAFTPYEQLLVGSLPRVDLVTQSRSKGQALKPIEIKLTALPDNSTCSLDKTMFGTEIVIRPDTIVYLACSIANQFKNNSQKLLTHFSEEFKNINDWSNGQNVWEYLPKFISTLDSIALSILEKQEPLLMQPIWKTVGKSPILDDNCLDVFIWSNLAFCQLFIDVGRGELKKSNKITRQLRTIIWLFKMLYDFANNGQINHDKIIDELSYNTKNDKAFAVSGRVTRPYMSCEQLLRPRISKNEIKEIILGGGESLLSPERRFDAIIYNTPNLFL